jgi:peptidoglycan/LPS O-acetylase OafA/YrhL
VFVTRQELPPLTGLRGLAAFAVVITHYAAWCSPWPLSEMPAAIDPLFGAAQIGMTLFFTLSGFVMTYHYADLDWRDRPMRCTAHFLWLRFSRIYPALAVALAVTPKNPPVMFALHALSIETVLPVKVAGINADSFSLTWSIGTEMTLYVLFALVMVLWHVAPRLRPVWASIGAVYVLALLVLMSSRPAAELLFALVPVPFEPHDFADMRHWFFYLSPWYRALEFALGGLAALYLTRWARPSHDRLLTLAAHCLFGLGVALWLYGRGIAGSGRPEYVIFAAAFAGMMAVGNAKTRLNAALSLRPLVFAGTISLSIYLLQGVIMNVAPAEPGLHFAWTLLPRFVSNFAVALLLLFCLGSGCYHLVEVPAKRLLRRVGGKTPRRRAMADLHVRGLGEAGADAELKGAVEGPVAL